MAEVTMPQLGETVTEGTITKWFKQVGEQVAEDEVLFEVSTDKVDSEVPSPAAGVLTEIRVPEGETVDVGTVLAVLGDAADAPAEGGDTSGESEAPEAPAEPPAAEAEAPPAEAPSSEQPAPPAPAPDPAVESAEGTAPAPQGPSLARTPPPASDEGSGLLLSPVVRRLVAEHGLDPTQIQGTGPGGRITRTDVQKAIESGGTSAPAPAAAPSAPAPAPAAAPAPAPARRAPAPAPTPRAGERDTVVPLNNIRRRTGEHMVMSKQVSPHVLTAVEVDFEAVERVRRTHGPAWKEEEGFSLTYLPFIARALVDAIRDFPHLNASVGDGELVVHSEVNLSIAVDIDFEGLLAPVVRETDTKRLRAIAREVVDLARRARSKQLSPDELAGGTITITNPGQYGTFMQFPVINQPQVAILSTDGIRRKPVVVTDEHGSESIAIHSVGILALAWDHRAFDGAYVAAFLDRLRENIETRDWEAEL
ncbi:dihydrolipoamide acetyltransferase family protein [Actinomarinicola tropica]|uniref:Dihydrolipoamide acetyltransferase component of pyruvate dehydrogenase complex n=1 Tax=Actinomarinicola tropica TaxID=2789776 RepID=A0A5Q2RK64_9ACTN|nr:dihydrolipoamide acetyltransferase family protein [Actinomarinicola tropica]QGG95874.1 dihydrolipoyllysine-residue succinyltransferase [Actinomarinicola tropica]